MPRLELGLMDSKSIVLPLHHTARELPEKNKKQSKSITQFRRQVLVEKCGFKCVKCVKIVELQKLKAQASEQRGKA